MSEGASLLPRFAESGMNRHSQLGPGALEPTQSHSTHSHTHRVTHVQSHVTSFRALNLTNLGTPIYSPEPPRWMEHNSSLESHTDLNTHQADTLVPHAHSYRQQIPGEALRGALWSLFLGAQPLRPPQQRLPQGPERFLGREHGVTAFRAIAPQAPSDHVAPGGWGEAGER